MGNDQSNQKSPLHNKSKKANTVRASEIITPVSKGSDGIIVVSKGINNQIKVDIEVDEILNKLANIPYTDPLLPTTSAAGPVPSPRDAISQVIYRIDPRCASQLAVRCEQHLRQCSEAVAFDQSSLGGRIAEIGHVIDSLNTMLTDKQRKLARLSEQCAKLSETSAMLNKLKVNVIRLSSTLEFLNDSLPTQLRLEPLRPIGTSPGTAPGTATVNSVESDSTLVTDVLTNSDDYENVTDSDSVTTLKAAEVLTPNSPHPS